LLIIIQHREGIVATDTDHFSGPDNALGWLCVPVSVLFV